MSQRGRSAAEGAKWWNSRKWPYAPLSVTVLNGKWTLPHPAVAVPPPPTMAPVEIRDANMVEIGQIWKDNYNYGVCRERYVRVVSVGQETAFIRRCEAPGSQVAAKCHGSVPSNSQTSVCPSALSASALAMAFS